MSKTKKDPNPVKNVVCLMNEEGDLLSGIAALDIFTLDSASRGFKFDDEQEAIDFLVTHSAKLGELAFGLKPVKGLVLGKNGKFIPTTYQP